MDLKTESELLDQILSFNIPKIPDETRFWMIRTQKGSFYDEFLAKKFVALAWNNIDETTDFSEQSIERLKDDIVIRFSEINRPSTVINKCKNFIFEVKEGDILVIPSKGSQYITFAKAGEYFEDSTKTVELERTVINRIKNDDVDINDVSCPYKKRRRIQLLRTIKSNDLNYTLYRAISNYHGISNFDAYSRQILNTLYNYYIFHGSAVLVYNVRKTEPIKPRELSGLLYSNAECLSMITNENFVSTQISLNSPGDAVYVLENIINYAVDNWMIVFGLLVLVGGGSALSFHVPGIIEIIKNIATIKSDIRIKNAEADSKELEVIAKRLEINEKLKASGIDPEALKNPLEILLDSTTALKTEPISLGDHSSIPVSVDEVPEIIDLDDDQE